MQRMISPPIRSWATIRLVQPVAEPATNQWITK